MNIRTKKTLFLVPCYAESAPALVSYTHVRAHTHTHTAHKDITQAFAFIKLINTANERCTPCVLQHNLFSWPCTCDTSAFNTPQYTPQDKKAAVYKLSVGLAL